MSTTITGLIVGAKYAVSFRANSRSATSAPAPTWSLNGGAFVPFTAAPPVGGMNPYYLNIGTFTATDITASLVLRNTSAPSTDSTVLLDDFQIARTGLWAVKRWMGDDSSGIAPERTMWAYHFGSRTPAEVNGFSVPAIDGVNPSIANQFSVTGIPNEFNRHTNSLTALGGQGSAVMANDFIYGGSPGQIMVQGLTVGQIYTVSFHGVGFDAAPVTRSSTFASDGTSLLVDENSFGQGNGMRVDHTFMATATTNVTSITPVNSNTFHLYGLSLSQDDYLAKPVVATHVATDFGEDDATLNGTVDPRNLATTVWFEWGPTTDYGNTTAPGPLPAIGVAQSVSANLTGLVPGNTYHFRVVASNDLGTNLGSNQSFIMPTFTRIPVNDLPGVFEGSLAWGDYDNDGRLDFLITGNTGSGLISRIWRNTVDGFIDVTSEVAAGLPGVAISSVAWGDYDNDGRLDFLITGSTANSTLSQIWRNTEDGFINVTDEVAPGLPEVAWSSVAWGDYDNDGRLDFLITGIAGVVGPVSQIWRNTENGFINVTDEVAPGLPGVAWSSVAWGDYDNDGRLDFLITGIAGVVGPVSQIWRNTENGFINVTDEVAPQLIGVYQSTVAWGDYDNDGRLDFLITGETQEYNLSQIWRNTEDGFINVTDEVAPGLPGVTLSSVAWGDYDNDGKLDFLITGSTGGGRISQIWRNTGNGFINATSAVAPGLPGVTLSSGAWGDYDNDGRFDFLITGASGGDRTSQIWRNTGNGFINVTVDLAPWLPPVFRSSVAWGDYDNDGRLDFLIMGQASGVGPISQFWRNAGIGINTPPTPPADLSGLERGIRQRRPYLFLGCRHGCADARQRTLLSSPHRHHAGGH